MADRREAIFRHRVAQRRARDPAERKKAKRQLTRPRYERGYGKKEILKPAFG